MVVYYFKNMRYCLYCNKLLEKKQDESLSAWARRIFCDRLCRQHMSHYKSYGNPLTRVKKLCPNCKIIKPLNDFGKAKGKPSGISYYCKECKRAVERLRKTGWSPEEYNKAYFIQNGLCDIDGCGRKIQAADHSHITFKPRGLLCARHNSILHHFDDLNEFNNILNYLKKYEKVAEERKER